MWIREVELSDSFDLYLIINPLPSYLDFGIHLDSHFNAMTLRRNNEAIVSQQATVATDSSVVKFYRIHTHTHTSIKFVPDTKYEFGIWILASRVGNMEIAI